ncbi:MAG: flavodoxin family protein [Clostridia bacterium]|nr:flavodoxin family protein [Clostridia bacterium]
MKVLLVNGSPHEHGATYTAMTVIAESLAAEGIESEIFWIGNQAVGGCMGCGYCRKEKRCVRNDSVNELSPRLAEFDGFVFGSAVHYAASSGALSSFMDRLFYMNSFAMRFKPAASVVSCRRGGATAAFDEINKYFTISEMPIVSSNYWNQIHGSNAEEAMQDTEGVQTMRLLGRNMAYVIKAFAAAKEAGICPPEREKKTMTNFIR